MHAYAYSIQSLPFEIKQEILVKWILNPRDVSRFARTSKEHSRLVDATWRQLYIRRFGPLSTQQQQQPSSTSTSSHLSEDVAQLYKRAHHSSLLREARQFGIVWGNDERYWQFEIIEEVSGVAHEIVSLRHVWWFDVNAEFLSVMPGVFTPSFRIRPFPHPPATNMMVTFSSRPTRSSQPWNEIYSTPYRGMVQEGSSEWIILRFPALTLDETGGFQDVRFYMWDHQSSVKQGLAIDYISLVPGDLVEKEQQQESISSRAAGFMSGLVSFFNST